MGKHTSIEWTATYDARGKVISKGHSWNPWRGCLKVSPGCRACYMYRDQERYGRDPRVIVRAAKATFNSPLKWHDPARVFTCSWSDWFIDQADEWRGEAWDIVRATPHLTYMILTKRPANIADRLPEDWGDGWPNVWLGVSVESQEYEWRIFELLKYPAAVHFLSAEPLLGPLDLMRYRPTSRVSHSPLHIGFAFAARMEGKPLHDFMVIRNLKWVITGGESGHATGKYKARPADMDWFRQIRDFCQEYGISYFHKQHGGTRKIDGAWGGRELDGRVWNEVPALESVGADED